MTGIAVVAILAVVLLGFVWSRMTTSRAERRSVDAHERRLDVLGHVAQRSDASAVIRKPTASELAQPHVKPSDAIGDFLPSNEYRPVSPPRVRLEPPVPPVPQHRSKSPTAPVESEPLPVFGDEVEAITGQPLGKLSAEALGGRRAKLFRRSMKRPLAKEKQPNTPSLLPEPNSPEPLVESRSEREEPLFELDTLVGAEQPTMTFAAEEVIVNTPQIAVPRNIHSRRVSDHTHRRVLTGAAAGVVVAAVAVGGWQIASKQPNHSTPPKTAATSKSHSTKSPKSTSPFSSAPGSSVQPVSNSDGLVTYPAPSGTYTVSFSSGSACWLGIQPGAGSNSKDTYLAMKTLASADSWSYQASGAIVVRIGAPKMLTVKINGETVALPPTVQPYDITFVPSNTTAA